MLTQTRSESPNNGLSVPSSNAISTTLTALHTIRRYQYDPASIVPDWESLDPDHLETLIGYLSELWKLSLLSQ